MEIRRLGLIEARQGILGRIYVLTPQGKKTLSDIDKNGSDPTFFKLLFEKEILFKQLIEMIRRKKRVYSEELFNISGINSVKSSFLMAILKQLPSVAKIGREGRKRYLEYVKSEDLTISSVRRILIRVYNSAKANRLFIPIDELWKLVGDEIPMVTEELFDGAVFDLAKDHSGEVELSQGISPPQAKLLFDKRSGTYFHYLKIPEKIIEGEMKNE